MEEVRLSFILTNENEEVWQLEGEATFLSQPRESETEGPGPF